ncbi:hypothetical protein BSKO_10478 [Bryopsis sp. KO-2023]|nr:hypothetical protein BSKO_10478 [Bryopsis sp. KO-2023]
MDKMEKAPEAKKTTGTEQLDMTLDQLMEGRPQGGRGSRGRGTRGRGRSGGGGGDAVGSGGFRSGRLGGGGGYRGRRGGGPPEGFRAGGVRKVVRAFRGALGGGVSGGGFGRYQGDRSLQGRRRKFEAMEEDKWQHDKFDDRDVMPPRKMKPQLGKSEGGPSKAVKLLISNLAEDVTDEDLLELFSSVGTVRRAAVFYDSSDVSKGTAEVTYEQHSDGAEAIKKFNGVCLDGKPLIITMQDDTSFMLSSGKSVTDPKTQQLIPSPAENSQGNGVYGGGPSVVGKPRRLRSSIVKTGLYADKIDVE